jgi:hypothetical protein
VPRWTGLEKGQRAELPTTLIGRSRNAKAPFSTCAAVVAGLSWPQRVCASVDLGAGTVDSEQHHSAGRQAECRCESAENYRVSTAQSEFVDS